MKDATVFRNGDVLNAPIERIVRVDLPIFLQAREERPFQCPDFLEVIETTVPTVEEDDLRSKFPLRGPIEHVAKVLVLGLAVLLVQPKVARHVRLAARLPGVFLLGFLLGGVVLSRATPKKSQQVDALDHLPVLPAPVPGNVFNFVGVRFIQRCIVQNQQSLVSLHHRFGFLPQRLSRGIPRVGGCLCSRRVKASCAGAVSPSGWDRDASVQVNAFCAATRKWM